MVMVLGLLLGPVLLLFGWAFYVDPQLGFNFLNWPFGGGEEPLTKSGKPAYRMRGVLIMASGAVILLVGIFA